MIQCIRRGLFCQEVAYWNSTLRKDYCLSKYDYLALFVPVLIESLYTAILQTVVKAKSRRCALWLRSGLISAGTASLVELAEARVARDGFCCLGQKKEPDLRYVVGSCKSGDY